MKYSFKNDYSEGCHPAILNALFNTNEVQQAGYGEDFYSKEAKDLIRKKFHCPEAQIHFVSGGTQANALLISSVLRPHQSVISADTGHIFTNEAGAIEATGHKVHGLETISGKLTPEVCENLLSTLTNLPHVVQPKILYISNATELGTHYLLKELEDLSRFCKEKNIYLYMDGARLGNALMADNNDILPEDIVRLADAFYLGGTKNGALMGEAIVIVNPQLQEDFAFHVKQKGALLAKGRLLGIQFLELMKNDLYFDLATKANEGAMKLKNVFEKHHFSFLTESYTNQIFPILPNSLIDELLKDFEFYVWQKVDAEHSAIRLITSWATPEAEVLRFIEILNSYCGQQ